LKEALFPGLFSMSRGVILFFPEILTQLVCVRTGRRQRQMLVISEEILIPCFEIFDDMQEPILRILPPSAGWRRSAGRRFRPIGELCFWAEWAILAGDTLLPC